MNATMVLSLMGGLGLFLFGIKTMGDGLETAAGNRMKHLLEILTRNKLTAVLIGAFITAVIQSSSATTVMVVGFVNAGLLQLSQAIGVIMGANIGTTITSLMLSVEIDFAIIFTAIGAVLQLAGNRPAVKLGGQIAMGLGMLFLGMDMMSSAMEPLRDWKGFQDMMVYAANPVVGVLVGALVTALLQSSAASIGILQSLAAAGAVVYAGHHRPIAGANLFQRLAARLRPVFSRASGRLTLTGFEFKKILWYHKGLLVLLVFALWCFRAAAAPTADVSLYDTDTAAFQNEFQGPATEDTLRAIRARIAEVEGWPESEIRSTQLAALSAVEAEALEKQDTGLWVLNPAPMFTLCGGDVGGSQRIPSMAALLTVALLTAGTFAGERQQRMLPLLQTTPRGRRREPRCKLALSALLAAAVWLTLTLRQVYQVSSYYGGLTALSAPLRSVTYFADLAADCTVGQWLAGCLLLRLLVLLAAAMTGCLLSSLCRTVNAAVVVCCAGLVGPAALELVGVRAAGILSLARLWTPVTCSLFVYFIPLALLVVCPLLCVRRRPRV